MQQTPELLRVLVDAGVEFVIIGGVAAIAHGSATFTQEGLRHHLSIQRGQSRASSQVSRAISSEVCPRCAKTAGDGITG